VECEEFIESLQGCLAGRPRKEVRIDGFQRAAVLLPLICGAGEIEILLTRRTDEVETHKGQIAFPGGVVEEGDVDSEATALREAEEEIGLPGDAVTVIGFLDDHPTPTGFVITPVVAVLQRLPPLQVNRHEVAEVLRLPLRLFTETERARHEERIVLGRTQEVWYFDTGSQIVWGATAAIIRMLLERLGTLP
jgi:8-oxo-dGTP pyrophosphatase MutT (NUDIX family)